MAATRGPAAAVGHRLTRAPHPWPLRSCRIWPTSCSSSARRASRIFRCSRTLKRRVDHVHGREEDEGQQQKKERDPDADVEAHELVGFRRIVFGRLLGGETGRLRPHDAARPRRTSRPSPASGRSRPAAAMPGRGASGTRRATGRATRAAGAASALAAKRRIRPGSPGRRPAGRRTRFPSSPRGRSRVGRRVLHPLHPHAQHAGHLFQTVAGAVVGRVRQAMPVRVAEVDDIDGWDAGRVQRQVVVLHGEATELVGAERRAARASAVVHRSCARSGAFQNEFFSTGNAAFLPPTMSSSTAAT